MKSELIINGVVYPTSFGIRTMQAATQILGGKLGDALDADLSASDSFDMMLAITRVALNEGARKSGSTERYSEDDVVDFFDADQALLEQVLKLFAEARTLDPGNLGALGESSPRAPKRAPKKR